MENKVEIIPTDLPKDAHIYKKKILKKMVKLGDNPVDMVHFEKEEEKPEGETNLIRTINYGNMKECYMTDIRKYILEMVEKENSSEDNVDNPVEITKELPKHMQALYNADKAEFEKKYGEYLKPIRDRIRSRSMVNTGENN